MIAEIGLTGGIGSGKSTVARIFQSFGFEVYFSDDRAKSLTETDPEVVEAIRTEFGDDIYSSDGKLERKKLANIVFPDPNRLKVLTDIIHPAVFRDGARWKAESATSGYSRPFCLKEAAISFESGSYKHSDGMIAIYAPKSVRLDRVAKRDATHRQGVLDRMNNQYPDAFKVRNSDFVIYNDGQHHIIPQIQAAIDLFTHKFAH